VADCEYCGQNAGLFRKRHPECQQRHEVGWKMMRAAACEAATRQTDLEALRKRLSELARTSYHKEDAIRAALIQGWEDAVAHCLNDSLLSRDEETALTTFATHFGLSQDDLNTHGAYTQATMAVVLRGLLEGQVPSRVQLPGGLQFNFQAGEQVVWVFPRADYYEQQARRSYVGGYQGVSVRVARGVYYRIGGFRGYPVETTALQHVATGQLAITTKHMYFGSAQKTFRIPYTKILSVTPYSDGIAVHRDAASAKPQIFVTGDGWFIYNAVSHVVRLSAPTNVSTPQRLGGA